MKDFRYIYDSVTEKITDMKENVRAAYSIIAGAMIIAGFYFVVFKVGILKGLSSASENTAGAKIVLVIFIFTFLFVGLQQIASGILLILSRIISNTGVIKVLILIERILCNVFVLGVGAVFIVPGVCTIFEDSNILGGIACIFIGLVPVAIAVYDSVKNYYFFKEYETIAMKDPLSKYYFFDSVGDGIYFIIGGGFFAFIGLFLAITIPITGMDAPAGLFIFVELFLLGFAAIGIFLIRNAIKNIRNGNNTYSKDRANRIVDLDELD